MLTFSPTRTPLVIAAIALWLICLSTIGCQQEGRESHGSADYAATESAPGDGQNSAQKSTMVTIEGSDAEVQALSDSLRFATRNSETTTASPQANPRVPQERSDDGRSTQDAPEVVESNEEGESEELKKAVSEAQRAAQRMEQAKQGELWAKPVINKSGLAQKGEPFPLKKTDVKAQISGFIAQTSVTQTYENPYEEPIEAVYIFPLPSDSAINGFTMRIGERTIKGILQTRAEAKKTYNKAKAAGLRASLLEQERPNIFTQSIANIAALEEIEIELNFMNRLKRQGGTYEWHFPMVVGPRYMGGNTPDAERIRPEYVEPGERSGNDISLSVELDAGLAVTDLRVPTHDYRQVQHSPSHYTIELAAHETIPNKDFVLEYDIMGADLRTGYAAHAADGEGFFALMVAPPKSPSPEDISPREVVFLIDVSGSMRGRPLSIAKDVVNNTITGLRTGDSFNIMTYASNTTKLWDHSKEANMENKRRARIFVDNLSGGGGTNMDLGISRMLALPRDGERMRMVAFLTDGYVGNEQQILGTIKNRSDESTRVFAFGIGSSTNRFLLEQIGKHGQGYTEILTSGNYHESDRAVSTFLDHMATPVFTHIEVDWSGLEGVQVETYPSMIPDVFEGTPVNLVARYDASQGPIEGTLILRGYLGGQPTELELAVDLPAEKPENAGLAAVWARGKIEDLADRRIGVGQEEYDQFSKQIEEVALAYKIVSEATSFVAVDSEGGKVGDGNPDRVDQPVEVPEGVDREASGIGNGGEE